MDYVGWTSLIRFLLLYRAVNTALIPEGVYQTECHDRFFMMAVDLSFTGPEPYFQAVDRTGEFPITEQYAAQCGYTVSVLTVPDIVELRASYFSCHTTNENDQDFTFNFNLIVTQDEENVTYAINRTCTPSLPWSPREVTCEVNYLEMSVKTDLFWPLGPKQSSWDFSMQMVYGSANPDWQVVLVKNSQEMASFNISEAHLNGYSFTETKGRLVFRTPYGQNHSSLSEINGIEVEVAHAILFSRREWVVLILDLVAACSLYEVAYDDGGYVTWETPVTLYPGLHTTNYSYGLNGKLWESTVAQKKGYSLTNDNATVTFGIPVNADGAYRKSVFTGDLFDLYTYHFYMEQIATNDVGTETRSRTFRKLTSPPIKRILITENRTAPNEDMFTVYLGNVPQDLELVAIKLNEKEFEAPFVNSSSYSLDIAASPNKTYDFTLRVPFDDPLVNKRFSLEKEAMENKLDIVYFVMIGPDSGPYPYHITATAFKDIAPPEFDASCSENGITFKLDHKPSNVLWDFTVGTDRLTPEFAAQQGYILSNDSQTLQLDVPLFTIGYKYEDITLDGFSGTFETFVRDRKTNEVQGSSVKTCPFTANEITVCAKDGKMTVVVDLSEVVAKGGSPVESSLLDEFCGPDDADETRALFSFSLNGCGTRVKLDQMSLTYMNEILYSINSTGEIGSIPIRCTYPLAALHPLFSMFKFESETTGVGEIEHANPSVTFPELQSSTAKPTTVPSTTVATKPAVFTTKASTEMATRRVKKPATKPTIPTFTEELVTRTRKTTAYKHTIQAKYVKVLSYNHNIFNRGKYIKHF